MNLEPQSFVQETLQKKTRLQKHSQPKYVFRSLVECEVVRRDPRLTSKVIEADAWKKQKQLACDLHDFLGLKTRVPPTRGGRTVQQMGHLKDPHADTFFVFEYPFLMVAESTVHT